MTIEEYLTNGVELEEMAMAHFERPSEDEEQRKIALAYSEGRHDVFKETLEKLSTFNHEVTLREVKEECEKHREGCGDCVLLCETTYSSPYYCEVGGMPARWNIDRIEKKMKEDIKQFNRGQNKTNE